MAMKEYSAFSPNSSITESSSLDYLMLNAGQSYSTAVMQSAYSAAQADWAKPIQALLSQAKS